MQFTMLYTQIFWDIYGNRLLWKTKEQLKTSHCSRAHYWLLKAMLYSRTQSMWWSGLSVTLGINKVRAHSYRMKELIKIDTVQIKLLILTKECQVLREAERLSERSVQIKTKLINIRQILAKEQQKIKTKKLKDQQTG